MITRAESGQPPAGPTQPEDHVNAALPSRPRRHAGLKPCLAQETPETEACKSTALLALKERSPSITDVVLDLDSLSIAKADTRVGDTPVRTVIIGYAYLERGRQTKPHLFLCLIGDKGKVLMTFFTQR